MTLPAAEPRRAVLIVDDDEDIRTVAGTILRNQGFAVATAADGREALEIIRSGLPLALILLDLRMPRMTGEEFKAALDRIVIPTPVVVLSGDGDLSSRAQSLGATAFARKPIELQELVALVKRYASASPDRGGSG